MNTLGTYVGVTFDKKTVKKLFLLCEKLKVPNPVNEFHSTVLFSKNEIDVGHKNDVYCAWTKKIEIWKKQDKNILVLTINSPQMSKFHNELILMGGMHDFENFNQHITLSYDIKDWTITNDFFMGFYLETKTMYVESLNLNN